MSIFVTKVDGSKQLFVKEKVVKTCLRMGVSRKIAEMVANEVERNLSEGISTEKIFQI